MTMNIHIVVFCVITQCSIQLICRLSNDTVNNLHYIASSDSMISNELERIWKEAAMS
jgi:hypothetical protein